MALMPGIEEVVRLKWIFGRDRRPLSIIGLRPREKVPSMKFKDQIDDGPWTEDRLRVEWQTAGGRLNPAILGGPLSGPHGLVIVDADNAAGLEWCRANLPPTPMATATRSAAHLYLGWNHEAEKQGNRVDVLNSKKRFVHECREAGFEIEVDEVRGWSVEQRAEAQARADEQRAAAIAAGIVMGPLVDIRGSGGYVVAPPAIHPSGFVYKQIEPWHADMVMPTWQLAWADLSLKWAAPAPRVQVSVPGQHPAVTMLRAARRAAMQEQGPSNCTYEEKLKRARAYLATIDPAIEGAGGQNTLFYAACRMVQGFLVEPVDALAMIAEDYNPRCQPPWQDWELSRKVDHAANVDCANAGFLLVDRPEWELRKHMHDLVSWDASAMPPPPEASDYGDDYYDDDGELVPAKRVVNGAPVVQPQLATVHVLKPATNWTGDDQTFAGLWKRLGVDDYSLVRDSEWIRAKTPAGTYVIKPNVNNITQVLLHGTMKHRDLRWNDLKRSHDIDGQPKLDIDEEIVRASLSHTFHEALTKENVESAIKLACNVNHYDPWCAKVEALPEWDGVDNLALFMTEVLGLNVDDDHDAWHQSYTEWRHQLTGVMARGLHPGSKVQTIMILVGSQGRRKSSLLQELIDGAHGQDKMFTDAKVKLDDRDGLMIVGTHNVMEWSESEHAKSARAVDNVKSFLARDHDVFREPYGKAIVSVKRRCVFFGTSNEREGLLHDPTGNRRFYICDLGNNVLNLKRLRQIHDQLWAQVRHVYAMYEMAQAGLAADPDCVASRSLLDASRWWYEVEEEKARSASLAAYQSRSVHYDTLASFVAERQAAKDNSKRLFNMDTVYAFMELNASARNKALESELAMTLKQMGCVKQTGQTRINGVKARWWQPPAGDQMALPGDDDFDPEF